MDFVSNDWTDRNQWLGAQGHFSTVRTMSGKDGAERWNQEIGTYIPFMIPPFLPPGGPPYAAPSRFGMPDPGWPTRPPSNVIPAPDLDADGVCDVLAFGFEWRFVGTPLTFLAGVVWWNFDGSLRLISGASGETIWALPINATLRSVFTPPIPCFFPVQLPCPFYEERLFEAYPTGFVFFESPTGPKFAWKTTDIQYSRFDEAEEYTTTERISLHDATTGESHWTRLIVSPSGGATARDNPASPIVTWLTGAAGLGDDPELEIVLDRYEYAPDEGQGLAMYASVLALRGTLTDGLAGGGTTLWGPTMIFTPRDDGISLVTEEIPEVYYWHYAAVVGDATDDGRAEIMAQYLTGPPRRGVIPLSEHYRTHFAPIDGSSGERIWQGKDVKLQGWGFASDVNAVPGRSKPFFAVGTVDVPTPTLEGTRFPPKHLRLSVMDAQTGEPRWMHRELFGLDTYYSYHLMLAQYLESVAKRDYNRDGVGDPVTPFVYTPPHGAHQVLVSNVAHRYDILDAPTGRLVRQLHAWGPSGRVIACAGEGPGEATVLSGLSKRFDLSRFALGNGSLVWRQPVFNDPTWLSMTAGTEVLYFTGRCAVDPASNTTLFGLNVGLYSLKRGSEIVALYGRVAPDGTLDWVISPLLGHPQVRRELLYSITPREGLSTAASALLSLPVILPGLWAGMALARWSRKRGKD